MSAMRAVEEHLADVLAAVELLGAETVAIADAHGTVLREPVLAANDIPAFDNSAMDGYAIRAADTAGATDESPVRLDVIGEVRAGTAPDLEVPRGGAIRIATGAPIFSRRSTIQSVRVRSFGLAKSSSPGGASAASSPISAATTACRCTEKRRVSLPLDGDAARKPAPL